MARTPKQQFEQDRRKINPLLREAVANAPPVGLVRLSGDDPGGGKLAEPVRKNVGRDALARLLKLLEGTKPANHQVANNQKRPAISENLERNADWARGAASWMSLAVHGSAH